jgi:hypothetical protein
MAEIENFTNSPGSLRDSKSKKRSSKNAEKRDREKYKPDPEGLLDQRANAIMSKNTVWWPSRFSSVIRRIPKGEPRRRSDSSKVRMGETPVESQVPEIL